MEKLEYFRLKDFSCKCSCGLLPSPAIMELIVKLRKRIGEPLLISSGARCVTYNTRVRGAKHSAHITGKAVDIVPVNPTPGWQDKYAALAEEFNFWYEDIKHTPTWFHVTIRPPVAWAPGEEREFAP